MYIIAQNDLKDQYKIKKLRTTLSFCLYQAQNPKIANQQVLIKVFNFASKCHYQQQHIKMSEIDQGAQENIRSNLTLQTNVNHQNVLKILETKEIANSLYIVEEFCQINLESLAKSQEQLQLCENSLKFILVQLIRGLDTIKFQFDLTPSQIMFQSTSQDEESYLKKLITPDDFIMKSILKISISQSDTINQQIQLKSLNSSQNEVQTVGLCLLHLFLGNSFANEDTQAQGIDMSQINLSEDLKFLLDFMINKNLQSWSQLKEFPQFQSLVRFCQQIQEKNGDAIIEFNQFDIAVTQEAYPQPQPGIYQQPFINQQNQGFQLQPQQQPYQQIMPFALQKSPNPLQTVFFQPVFEQNQFSQDNGSPDHYYQIDNSVNIAMQELSQFNPELLKQKKHYKNIFKGYQNTEQVIIKQYVLKSIKNESLIQEFDQQYRKIIQNQQLLSFNQFITSQSLFIISEKCQYTLDWLLFEQCFEMMMEEDSVILVMQKLIETIQLINQQNVVLQRIKLEDIILVISEDDISELKSGQLTIKSLISKCSFKIKHLGDDQFKQRKDRKRQKINQSRVFKAPEILQMKDNLPKPEDQCLCPSNVYNLGVILYVLLTGNFPFIGATDEEQLSLLMRGELIFDNVDVSPEFKELIQTMLSPNIEERCRWQVIYNQSFQKQEQPLIDYDPPHSDIRQNQDLLDSSQISLMQQEKNLVPQEQEEEVKAKTDHQPINKAKADIYIYPQEEEEEVDQANLNLELQGSKSHHVVGRRKTEQDHIGLRLQYIQIYETFCDCLKFKKLLEGYGIRIPFNAETFQKLLWAALKVNIYLFSQIKGYENEKYLKQVMQDKFFIENQLKMFEEHFNLRPKGCLLTSLENMRYGLATSNIFMIFFQSFPPLNTFSIFFQEIQSQFVPKYDSPNFKYFLYKVSSDIKDQFTIKLQDLNRNVVFFPQIIQIEKQIISILWIQTEEKIHDQDYGMKQMESLYPEYNRINA